VSINARIPSTVLAAVICLSLPTACGTSPASGSSSGPPVDPSKTLAELTPSEMQAFCDWTNQKQGGYGQMIPCDAGGSPLETDPNQATCVAELSQHASMPHCSSTVAQWTMFVEWFLANWCGSKRKMPPAEFATIQATCYPSGAPSDGGGD